MQINDISEDRLARLTELSAADGHVISVVLDLDPRAFATPPARASAVRSVLDEARARVQELEGETTHEEQQALREDVARLERFLTDDLDAAGAHALAIYCSGPAGLFEVLRLPQATPSSVSIGRAPLLAPLMRQAPSEPWAVAVIARGSGRILVGTADRLEEVSAVESDVHGQHQKGGWSQGRYERTIDEDTADHVRMMDGRLARLLQRRPFEHLLVATNDELWTVVQETLSGELQRRLAGRVPTDLQHAPADEILAAALPAMREAERAHEEERLQALQAGLAKGTLGVAGRRPTAEMLEQRRVETLLVADGADDADDFLQGAVAAALEQSAEVLFLRHHEEAELDDGIAAVLRF